MDGARIFIAAPMSGFSSEEDYIFHREKVLAICENLEANRAISSVYFAGRRLSHASTFDDPKEAMRLDFMALKGCSLFVLYYPSPIRSSVLVEAGIAIGFQKSCFFACRQLSDLPYLLRNTAESDRVTGIPRIDVWEWNSQQVDPDKFAKTVLEALSIFAVA
jgi:hypothetical protein